MEHATDGLSFGALREQREKEKEEISFDVFISKFKELASEGRLDGVNGSTQNGGASREQVIVMREPIDFIDQFKPHLDSREDCNRFLHELIDSRDPRVVQQMIAPPADLDGLWFNDTMKGINLRPGFENGERAHPDSTVLGSGGEKDPVHGLVGGATGSGKSVFLNQLICTMIAEYPPWELALYLADFKKVELSRYLSHRDTPHVRAVAATSEIRYVVSLIDYLVECMNARQDILALLGLQNLKSLRNDYGVVLPRVLLLIDEFQQMFVEATPREGDRIKEALTVMTKLGRATGFHLFFASQDMSGTVPENVKANFGARFALKCNASISTDLIGSSAAADIERGTVLYNAGARKNDGDIRSFRVPLIKQDAFYKHIERICALGEKASFSVFHKYYQEDFLPEFSKLSSVLAAVKDVRAHFVGSDDALSDLFVLGNSVVFNSKRNDYETAPIEHGLRKNITVLSPDADDAAYICKLLAENFKTSPNAERYRHFIIIKDELLLKKYDLITDLGVPERDSTSLDSVLIDFKNHYLLRAKVADLVRSHPDYTCLYDYALKSCKEMMQIWGDASHDKSQGDGPQNDGLKNLCAFFEGIDLEAAPMVIERYWDEITGIAGDFRDFLLTPINAAYARYVEECPLAECFDPYVIWILGVELLDQKSQAIRDFERFVSNVTNYNMRFVLVCSAEFDKLRDLCVRPSEYLFVTGSVEKFYTACNMPYKKKAAGSSAIDFLVKSTNTLLPFKKFRYELNEVRAPSIDFDKYL